MTARRWPYLAHLPVVALLFSGVLFEGRVPYYRDLLTHYYPDYVFVAQAARQGILWPLWNPLAHAGSAFLMPYPIDLLSVHLLGPLSALRVDAPLHVLIAMCGATLLAARLGVAASGSWATGLFYGLSGLLLSASNSMQFFHAAAWAPWVVAAALSVLAAADASRCALLALLLALQVSTLAVDVTLQTALVVLFLLPGRPSLRALASCAAAAIGAALIAAPVLLGTTWMLEGTPRGRGFGQGEALFWSASPTVLLEAVVPRLFGNVRSFSEQAYWGRPFFEGGFPYFMSLYLGAGVLLLAALAGWQRRARSLWLLALLGLLLSLGRYGPLGPVEATLLGNFRYPVKYFLMTNLALCLLAGMGVARCEAGERLRSPWRLAPGLALLAAAAVLASRPGLVPQLLAGLIPELGGAGARFVAEHLWPAEFLRAGALAVAAAFALGLGRNRGVLAAGLVAMDLLSANLGLNPAARRDFYELAPPLRELVARAAQEGPYRWLSLSLNAASGARLAPWATDSDVVVYRAVRQTLLGTSSALDGLESALELYDSFAPRGATLPREERAVERFREFAPAVRLANVRWILSVADLPDDLVRLRSRIEIPGLAEPLRFYELVDPVERAFWVPGCEIVPDAGEARKRALGPGFDAKRSVLLEGTPGDPACRAAAPAEPDSEAPRVRVERPDPHTRLLHVRSPRGWIVVVEGFHGGWEAEAASGPVPLLRADGSYWALPTPGGSQEFTIRLRPRWPTPALWLSALAVVGAAVLVAKGRPRLPPG